MFTDACGTSACAVTVMIAKPCHIPPPLKSYKTYTDFDRIAGKKTSKKISY